METTEKTKTTETETIKTIKTNNPQEEISEIKDFEDKTLFEFYREKIQHEDSLIQNRVNWLFVIEGGLLVMYLSNYKSLDGFRITVILIGLLSTCFILTNIIIGQSCLTKIRSNFKEDYPSMKKKDRRLIIGYEIERHDEVMYWIKMVISSTITIPCFFLFFWGYLLLELHGTGTPVKKENVYNVNVSMSMHDSIPPQPVTKTEIRVMKGSASLKDSSENGL